MITSQRWRAARAFGSLFGVLIVLFYIFSTYHWTSTTLPEGEWCSLIYIDLAQRKVTEKDSFELLWRSLDERANGHGDKNGKDKGDGAGRGAISVRIFIPAEKQRNGSTFNFRNILPGTPTNEHFVDIHPLKTTPNAISLEEIKKRIEERRSEVGHHKPGSFPIRALENSERTIQREKRTLRLSCKKWEIFLISEHQEITWTQEDIEKITSRSYRLCPTETRIVFLDDPPTIDVARIDFFEKVGHVTLETVKSYYDSKATRRHLILMDISGSVRTNKEWYETEYWYEEVFTNRVLPSFLSMVPFDPDHRFRFDIFGKNMRTMFEGSVEDLVITPRLTRKIVNEVDPEQTYLTGVLDFLKKDGRNYRSVWLYTDGEDMPKKSSGTESQSSLKDWKKANCSVLQEASRGPEGRVLYLHVPVGIAENDQSIIDLKDVAERCLGFETKIMPAPPPPQALALCSDN